ncbi:HAUS augmin-like complex subunit 2 isoform 2-T2 [Discoglossus pictus]
MATNPWDPVQPNAAGLLIEKCLGLGLLPQKSLELELLRLEKETADIAHPLFLRKKCQALQAMNTHLEAVLKEKRTLRQRLAKPLCQENLPIEASYQRYAAELLPLAVDFIQKLEVYLETIKTIPKIPESSNKMDNALVRMESLEAEMEELSEHILTWREQQRGLVKGTFQMNSESDGSCMNAPTSYLSIENHHP